MFSFILGLLIGLMLGWFFLPTPTWATKLYNMLVVKFPFLKMFVKK